MPKEKTRKIFISATGQNDGKTVVSLGLIFAFKERFGKIGFIKPVGQRYLIVQGEKIDEDSVLIEKACGIECAIKDMSPVAIERGFTRRYILEGNKKELAQRIKASFKAVAKDKDFVVIEGTGHAGVGSCFDLSNAVVAKLLGSKVIILTPGGVGRPIDEAMLNKALFDAEGVELAGVVVNKVLPQKFKKVKKFVKMGFEKKNLPVLSVLPYQKRLDLPTMREIFEELKIKLLCGEKNLENTVDRILIGDCSTP